MKPYAVVLSTKSGQGHARIKRWISMLFGMPIPEAAEDTLFEKSTKIKAGLSRFGNPVKLYKTQYKGHAKDLVREILTRPCEAIIAVGGDGTINEVITAMGENQIPVGIIPSGTANVFANEYGIPLSIEGACQRILKKEPREHPVGQCNSSYFSLFCGIGFDAAVIQHADRTLKQKLGALSYGISALWILLMKRHKAFDAKVNGEFVSGIQAVLVMSGSYYGGNYILVEPEWVNAHTFNVVIVKKISLRKIIRGLAEFKREKKLSALIEYTIKPLERLEIVTEGVPYHYDGEYSGISPLMIKSKKKSCLIL